jgi:hypothetical protein
VLNSGRSTRCVSCTGFKMRSHSREKFHVRTYQRSWQWDNLREIWYGDSNLREILYANSIVREIWYGELQCTWNLIWGTPICVKFYMGNSNLREILYGELQCTWNLTWVNSNLREIWYGELQFTWNWIWGTPLKICWEISNLVKIGHFTWRPKHALFELNSISLTW